MAKRTVTSLPWALAFLTSLSSGNSLGRGYEKDFFLASASLRYASSSSVVAEH